MTASTTADQPTPQPASETLRTLNNGTELWTASDIAEYFGVSRNLVWHWVRACRNYQFHGATTWPPTQLELRHAYEPTPHAKQRDWWPDHPTILPPVDLPGATGRDRWFKESVLRWGRRTKRIDPAGKPIPLKAGTRSRGRSTGRAPTAGRADPGVE